MAHPNESVREKIITLEGYGLEIWRVHVDALKEQDKNARYMDKRKFDRLKANIKKEGRLESLPFCHMNNDRIEIISGHHRVRAARLAEEEFVYVLVEPNEMSRSQVIAKQLAHNALSGEDDRQTLQELWDEISDLESKLETGIDAKEFDMEKIKDTISIDALRLNYDYKIISLVFLPSAYEKFIDMLNLVDNAFVGLAEKKVYDPFTLAMKKVSATEDVRNVSAVLMKMAEIIEDYYRAIKPDPEDKIEE